MKTPDLSDGHFAQGYGPQPGARRRPAQLSRAQSRVLAVLEDAAGPLTLAELTGATGLHANTLREHLDALEASDLVRRHQAEPSGPGRPPTLFVAAASAGSTEYAGLAAALAATIHRTSDAPERDGAEAGEGWGHELATDRGRPGRPGEEGARREVIALLDDLGFATEADRRGVDVRLTRCPLLDTARRYPDVVCAVHLGIVRGALEEYGADPSGVELHPFAEPGACSLHLGHRAAARR